jgi:site-specific DNA recombinase
VAYFGRHSVICHSANPLCSRLQTGFRIRYVVASIQERLIRNTELTVHDIAREERVSAAYIYNLLRLPWLAPDITAAIVNGRQPQQLNAKSLMRQASRLPADWIEQRVQLGFR